MNKRKNELEAKYKKESEKEGRKRKENEHDKRWRRRESRRKMNRKLSDEKINANVVGQAITETRRRTEHVTCLQNDERLLPEKQERRSEKEGRGRGSEGSAWRYSLRRVTDAFRCYIETH